MGSRWDRANAYCVIAAGCALLLIGVVLLLLHGYVYLKTGHMPVWPLRDLVLLLTDPKLGWHRWLVAPDDWLGLHTIVSAFLAIPVVIYLLVIGWGVALAGFDDLR